MVLRPVELKGTSNRLIILGSKVSLHFAFFKVITPEN